MAFAPAPDVNGNASVGAICVATCSQKSPAARPNPNGEHGGGLRSGADEFRAAGGAQGNGSGGSPGGGWPAPVCEQCPECERCPK